MTVGERNWPSPVVHDDDDEDGYPPAPSDVSFRQDRLNSYAFRVDDEGNEYVDLAHPDYGWSARVAWRDSAVSVNIVTIAGPFFGNSSTLNQYHSWLKTVVEVGAQDLEYHWQCKAAEWEAKELACTSLYYSSLGSIPVWVSSEVPDNNKFSLGTPYIVWGSHWEDYNDKGQWVCFAYGFEDNDWNEPSLHLGRACWDDENAIRELARLASMTTEDALTVLYLKSPEYVSKRVEMENMQAAASEHWTHIDEGDIIDVQDAARCLQNAYVNAGVKHSDGILTPFTATCWGVYETLSKKTMMVLEGKPEHQELSNLTLFDAGYVQVSIGQFPDSLNTDSRYYSLWARHQRAVGYANDDLQHSVLEWLHRSFTENRHLRLLQAIPLDEPIL